jgi:hypothetical protein
MWQVQGTTVTLNNIASVAGDTLSKLSNFHFHLEEVSKKKLEDLMAEIRQYNIKLVAAMSDLHEHVDQMGKNASTVNQIANDPAICRVIEDLKEVGSRFDNI